MKLRNILLAGACLFAAPASAQSTFTTQMGVNLSGAEFGNNVPGVYGTDYTYPTAAEAQYYVSKGLKYFRLPFLWERIQPNGVNTTIDATQLGYIRSFLASANSAGGHVILDLHNYGKYNGTELGGGNGVTGAALANVWGQIATALKGTAGLAGYDVMNEPQGFATGSEWPADAQLAVTAIRNSGATETIYMEGDCWSGAWDWQSCNGSLNISDPSSNLIYEAHQYFDANSSGTYSAGSYAGENATPNTGSGRIAGFITWLKANGFRGMIGEYSIPNQDGTSDNDALWLATLDNMLTTMDTNCLGGTVWGGGPWWGSYPESVEPVSGVDSIQMSVLKNHTGVANCAISASTSPSGTRVTSNKIVDGAGVVWTVDNSGNSYENGVADGGTTILDLVYFNGNVYAYNSTGWWLHANGNWSQVANPMPPSASGTTIPSAAQIIDAAGTVWTVVGGLSYENGIADSGGSISQLLYKNGVIYANVTNYGWFSHETGSWVSMTGSP